MSVKIRKTTPEQKQEAIDHLKGRLKPGMNVYTLVRNVSGSGMSRRFDVYYIADNELHYITKLVARATGLRLDNKHEQIVMGGTGMDMGAEIVYVLSETLFAGMERPGYQLHKQRI